jgi:tetratricopeptide (TPR) repeat protein
VQSEPELLLNLARQEIASGQLAAAESKLQQLLQSRPLHPGALSLLGQVYSTQGRHEDAVKTFGTLTQAQSEVAGNWSNLGTALRLARRHDDSLSAFERALKLGPPNAGLLYNLGLLQMDRCDYQAAYLALRDAARLAPREAAMRWAYAQCCFELSLLEEALAALEGWQTFERLSVDLTVRMILLLVAMGAHSRAADVLERMRKVPPTHGRVGILFSSILERLNHLDEARAVLESTVRSDPDLANDAELLLMSAVLAERAGDHETALGNAELAIQHNQGSVRGHTLLFAKAKACDALGRYDEAFATAVQAHQEERHFLQAGTGISSAEQSQTWALSSLEASSAEIPSRHDGGPSALDSPIFLVGFPRSGTTLIEQVLDAHPALHTMDEQPLLMRMLDDLKQQGARYPGDLATLSEQSLDALRSKYRDRARQRDWLPGSRLVDKNPLNMVLLPLIRTVFPRSPLVLVVRHPCDTLLSCFLQHFRAPGVALLFGDLRKAAGVYDRLFRHWYRNCELLQPSCYELSYERTVRDLPAVVTELTAFLGLPAEQAMLDPAKMARAKNFISTPSYSQVIEPVNDRSVGRWTHYRRHFEAVLPALTPWIERWGYSLQ